MARKRKEVKSKKQLAKEKAEKSVKAFENELRNAVLTAMTAAFGFLMALTWRDLIIKAVEKISGGIALGGELISALVVTIICVFSVMILTKILGPKNNPKK